MRRLQKKHSQLQSDAAEVSRAFHDRWRERKALGGQQQQQQQQRTLTRKKPHDSRERGSAEEDDDDDTEEQKESPPKKAKAANGEGIARAPAAEYIDLTLD